MCTMLLEHSTYRAAFLTRTSWPWTSIFIKPFHCMRSQHGARTNPLETLFHTEAHLSTQGHFLEIVSRHIRNASFAKLTFSGFIFFPKIAFGKKPCTCSLGCTRVLFYKPLQAIKDTITWFKSCVSTDYEYNPKGFFRLLKEATRF